MTTREEFREQVRERTDLIALIQQTVTISRIGGRTVKCKCPFHDDGTASLAIWPEQQRWKCFGACNDGGDAFAWVMKRDGCDFPAAVETLARDANLEIPSFREEAPEKRKARLDARELLDLAADYYHTALLKAAAAQPHRDYLIKRGFGEAFWEQWYVGAAGGNNGLLKYFQQEGVDLELAKAVDLIKQGDDGHLYDTFRNRIVIPFLEAGRVTYFTGRDIAGHNPKYLHLTNTEYAHKTPFNWRAVGKRLIVVEGALDVWAADALAPDGVAVIALMGLAHTDPLLVKAMAQRDKVYVGLDSDGTVRSQIVEDVARLAGPERAHLLRWPSGDDAAAWLQQGATTEQFGSLLESAPSFLSEVLRELEQSEDKPERLDHAIQIALGLSPARADEFVGKLKRAVRGVVQAATVDKMVKAARAPKAATVTKGEASDDLPYYSIRDGELWAGNGEMAHKVTLGGVPVYTEAVTVDDGETQDLQLVLEVRLKEGKTYTTRVPSSESGDEGKVVKYIKEVAGPFLTIGANQKKHLPPGIETVSRAAGLGQRVEIAHTGWVETSAGLAYCTPNGVVGELPAGHSVALPSGFSEGFGQIRVHDDGDEAFEQGLDGLLNGLLVAFEPEVTYPLMAFALLPVAARWLPKRKFAMHLSGETGSLKTHTAKAVMSLYGRFADMPPLMSWRSTMNAVELTGFWLPDMLGLVDDYKPSIVKPWDFTELIQRYADGNARMRLSSAVEIRRKQSMRWWMLSTGEDIPVGESSVLARMITLRFPRRPQGEVYNASLGKAQRLAEHFPTVTARWAAWLRENADEQWFPGVIQLKHQEFGAVIQKAVSGAPNASRIAENLATLSAVWGAWCEFLGDSGVERELLDHYRLTQSRLLQELAVRAAQQVADEKPTKQFLETVQAGLDSGRYFLVERTGDTSRTHGFLGFYDDEGVYLLPAAYQEVSKWLRESGLQLGFHQKELYRLLTEEGLLVRVGKGETTVVVKVGGANSRNVVRALHLKRDQLSIRVSEGGVAEFGGR